MARQVDFTHGPPRRLLVAFALPTLAGNLLHQAYSLTDSLVVGRYLGQTSLAAVGCTTPVVLLLAAVMIGLNMGSGILASQAVGRQDFAAVRRLFCHSLLLNALLAAVLAVAGVPLAVVLLRWLGTPEAPLAQAAAYLRVNLLTSLCPMLYHLFSGLFRALGDSRTALYCLIVSSLGNVALDVLFVAVLHGGVVGTAWATALAQGASALFAGVALWRKYPAAWPRRSDWRIDPALLGHITVLAVPLALQSAFNNLGNLIAQSAVNCFGEAVMAAYTVAGRLGALCYLPMESLSAALSIYAGQNEGAGRRDRIRSGLRAGVELSLGIGAVLAAVLLVWGRALAALFLDTPDPALLALIDRFLRITAVPGALYGIMQCCQQTLRGMGKPGWAMAGGLCQLGTKIACIAWGCWGLGVLEVVWLGWPLSFVAGTVLPLAVLVRAFRQ